LGVVGIRLITRDGRTIAHFDYPADRIVVSENGNRIIALARRGEVWGLSKVDVQSRRATPWRHAEITRFTTNFDGASWFILCGEDLYVLDATSNHLDAMWRISPSSGDRVAPFAYKETPGRIPKPTRMQANKINTSSGLSR
jgi:hypothetical protein